MTYQNLQTSLIPIKQTAALYDHVQGSYSRFKKCIATYAPPCSWTQFWVGLGLGHFSPGGCGLFLQLVATYPEKLEVLGSCKKTVHLKMVVHWNGDNNCQGDDHKLIISP